MTPRIIKYFFFSLFAFLITATIPAQATLNGDENSAPPVKRFEAGKGTFLLDGEPFVIKAAELHYPRIPQPYWDQRIKLSKALGMNAICIYVFWNFHEETPDKFDFTGNKDLREFIRLCDENDMKVIVRPGPYVCAEWEMGGLPWWLLKNKDVRLREDDPYFLERVKKFEEAVAQEISHLTIENGGPVIMMQVENEYGAYGVNKPYVAKIRDMLKELYPQTLMFQCDWSSNFLDNGLDDLLWTMNFGTGADVASQFEELKRLRPDSPLMCSEFWSGWFDKWGAAHETRPADEMVAGIDRMLNDSISFSLYMTHGGTNWGHWAGANSPGYSPDVTSYDYDAPITENGQPTEKYYLLRETLARHNDGKSLHPLPELIEPIGIDKFEFTHVAPLFENLPEAKNDSIIRSMEEYGQGFGSILYVTTLPELNEGAVLNITEPHDFAQIFINGNFIGTLDRRKGENSLTMPHCNAGEMLEILVEAMGRINFGRAIKDFKGITENVFVTENIGNASLNIYFDEWAVYNLHDDLDFYQNMNFIPLAKVTKDEKGRFPRGVYKGVFNVDKPSDTFLNFETWGKGLVYVNGHALGRIWEIGPQQTLYMPGCWLKAGENEILVFDIIGPDEPASEGLKSHIVNKLNLTGENQEKEILSLNLDGVSPVIKSSFNPGNGWKEIAFKVPTKGRFFILRAIDGQDENEEQSAIAELYLLDESGNNLPRESWKIIYSDSEDMASGNNVTSKVFDLQESTYWQTEKGNAYPHEIIIDLGKQETINGIKMLPRVEKGAPGAIRNYEIYLTDEL